MNYKKFLLFLFISLAAGFSFANAESPLEQWTDVKKSSMQQAEQNLSSVIIYRPKSVSSDLAINIYIDGEYQASLLSGSFTQAVICPGNHNFTIAYTNILTKYKEKKIIGQKFFTKAKRLIYLSVVSSKDKTIHLEKLSSSEASEGIKKLNTIQNHTITRVAKRNCNKPARHLKSIISTK